MPADRMDWATHQDLHLFVDEYLVRHPDDVLVIQEQVARDQGTTGLVWELASRGRDEMVVCQQVEGLSVPILTNVFASRRRIARILGVDVAELHGEYQRRAAGAVGPSIVDAGPVFDHVDEGDAVDLASIPMVRHFAGDAADYITSGVVIAEGLGDGGNMSYHRAMVHSRNELATSLHSHGDLWRMVAIAADRGQRLPVAMVLGGHPLFLLAASARLPFGVDERDVAGGLFGEPLRVVSTPRYGIRVPATADFVLEGTIDPEVRVPEGPFGEFSGYFSHRSTNSLIRVESIMRRNDAMLLDIVGGNSAEHLNLSRVPRESEMAERLKARFPDVSAVHWPSSGTHFHCYVALKQRRPGDARQVMLALLGWDPYLKLVVAVDDDVDVTRDPDVLWAIAVHFQPHRDLLVVDGLPGSVLDPSSSPSGMTSRMGIDATRGPDFSGTRITLSESVLAHARRLLATAESRSRQPGAVDSDA